MQLIQMVEKIVAECRGDYEAAEASLLKQMPELWRSHRDELSRFIVRQLLDRARLSSMRHRDPHPSVLVPPPAPNAVAASVEASPPRAFIPPGRGTMASAWGHLQSSGYSGVLAYVLPGGRLVAHLTIAEAEERSRRFMRAGLPSLQWAVVLDALTAEAKRQRLKTLGELRPDDASRVAEAARLRINTATPKLLGAAS